jgi:glycosyltransferase 2 family protein
LRAVLRTILVIALAVGLLAVFLRNADLTRVWAEMQSAKKGWLGAALGLTFVMYVVRAERWQYMLAPLGHTRFWVAFRTTVIGFAASFVLPARAGEVLRPYLLARSERLPATAAFATIVLERVLDLVTVLILLGLFLAAFASDAAAAAPGLFQAVAVGGLALAPVGLALLVGMFVVAGHPERLHRLMLRVERLLPTRIAHAVANFARTFAEGLAAVRHPRRLVFALAWSFVLWLAIAAQVWVLTRAFEVKVPFPASFLLTAMLVVGVSIPTPGGVGGSHEALRLGLTSFYGVDNDVAVGIAILQHGVNFVPVTLLGLWLIIREGLTFGRLREMSASARNQSHPVDEGPQEVRS